MVRVSIDRGRLHAGHPPIRVQSGRKFKFAEEAVGEAFVLRRFKVKGRWVLYLFAEKVETR